MTQLYRREWYTVDLRKTAKNWISRNDKLLLNGQYHIVYSGKVYYATASKEVMIDDVWQYKNLFVTCMVVKDYN